MLKGAERRVAASVTRVWRAVLALLALAVCLPLPVSAELNPVGLDAHGVDVRASLRGDLDVRDAFNRPVSRALVERQIAGAARAADPTPKISRLPMIQAVWEALNRVLLGVGLRRGRSTPGGSSTVACPWRLPGPPARVAPVLTSGGAPATKTISQRPAACRPPDASRPQVLRC